jgi:hypothetical protein
MGFNGVAMPPGAAVNRRVGWREVASRAGTSITPLPAQDSEGASGLVGKAVGVAAAPAERERQRRLLLERTIVQ